MRSLPVGEGGTALALLWGLAGRARGEAGWPPARARVAMGMHGCRSLGAVPCRAGGRALALDTRWLAGAGGPGQAGVRLTSSRREQGQPLSATWWGDACQASSWQPEPPLSLRSWPEKVYGPFAAKKEKNPKHCLCKR